MEKFRVHLLVAEQSRPSHSLPCSNQKLTFCAIAVLWVSMTFSTLVAGNESSISTARGLLNICEIEAVIVSPVCGSNSL